MWFESLMNDFKRGIIISNRHKDIFVPVFLKLAMFLILGIVGIIGLFTTIASGVFSGINNSESSTMLVSMLLPIIVMIIIGYITYLILWAFIEVGSLGLIKAAINDEKPSKKHFFDSIKSYLLKAAGGKFLIHFVSLCLSPIIMLFFIIFVILIGIPTGGWGVIFLQVSIGVFFAMWTVALVNSDLSVIKALKTSFKLGKSNFKPMFLLVLTGTMFTQYIVTLLGPVGLVLAGWFIGGVSTIYFKLIIYLKYLEYSVTSDKPVI